MKYIPKNTVAHFLAAPQGHQHNLSAVPVSVFSAATKLYRETCGQTVPHNDALTFYALNHCAAIVRKSFTLNEPLPTWAEQVLQSYGTVCNAQGKRMLHYILSICAREMRHLNVNSKTVAYWNGIKNAGGMVMVDFIKGLTHYQEDDAVNYYMESSLPVTVEEFLKSMSYAFHHGWPGGGGFGGPKWGAVADAALSMVQGKTSMEAMVDTGYNLAHNGGPIFDKQMMYTHYDNTIITILDAQRAGQIPNLMLDPETSHTVKKTPEAVAAVKHLTSAGMVFEGWVNWILVDSVRPADLKHKDAHRYKDLIAKQKKAHPGAALAATKAITKTLGGKKIKVTGIWDVMPGVTVEVFERVAS